MINEGLQWEVWIVICFTAHAMHPSAAPHYMQSRQGYPPGAPHPAAQAMPHGAQASMMSRGLPGHPQQPVSLPHEHSNTYPAKSHLSMQHHPGNESGEYAAFTSGGQGHVVIHSLVKEFETACFDNDHFGFISLESLFLCLP